MDDGGHLVFKEAQLGGQGRIENFIDITHFDEVVAGTQGAQLVLAPVHGKIGDQVGVSPVDPPSGLDVGEVSGLAEAFVHRPASAIFENLFKHGAGELEILAPGTHPRRDVVEQGIDQVIHAAGHLLPLQLGAEQAYAAIDVVADAAGRDDAVYRVKGRHAADGEAVAPMDVGHGHGGPHDSRQGGDVGHLLEALILLDGGQHLPGTEDQPPGAHFAFPGNLPAIVVELLELHHKDSGRGASACAPSNRADTRSAPTIINPRPPWLASRPVPGTTASLWKVAALTAVLLGWRSAAKISPRTLASRCSAVKAPT